jgi:hypothetical protein
MAVREQWWIRTHDGRLPFGKVIVAIANKHARQIRAMLAHEVDLEPGACLNHPMHRQAHAEQAAQNLKFRFIVRNNPQQGGLEPRNRATLVRPRARPATSAITATREHYGLQAAQRYAPQPLRYRHKYKPDEPASRQSSHGRLQPEAGNPQGART